MRCFAKILNNITFFSRFNVVNKGVVNVLASCHCVDQAMNIVCVFLFVVSDIYNPIPSFRHVNTSDVAFPCVGGNGFLAPQAAWACFVNEKKLMQIVERRQWSAC